MALKEYARKRDFSKTPEPRPLSPSGSPGSRFFVQRHDASHLHYDFRLAIGGVLKSWAVPKGPSMDPAHKRLAMEVEDHPVAYGTFEGTIPKGEYGGGSVMLWDTGAFETEGPGSPEQQWEKGHLKLRLHGEKLTGTFTLVRMRGKATGREWLLVKSADVDAQKGWSVDDYAFSILTNRTQEQIAANTPKPTPIAPMLATLETALPEGPDWLYEVKWDGVRVICTVERGGVALQSRNGQSYNASFPELLDLPRALSLKSGTLDGEIVAVDAAGRSRFEAIQPRLGRTRPGNGSGPNAHGIALYLFDLLAKDGNDLRGQTLRKRRGELSAIFRPNERFRLSNPLNGTAASVMAVAVEHRLEGIIAKRWSSQYVSGRSHDWVKVKLQQRQEFVVCGWLPGKRSFSALVLGLLADGQLTWCGNVGTGFSEAAIRDIHATLKATAIESRPRIAIGEWPPKMHWVPPALTAEVKFAEWTTNRHLRAPVFVGLKPDRAAKEFQMTESKTGPTPSLTNLDKVYFPKDKITKGDLLAYYREVAPVLLPHLKDRPASLKRYPDGITGEPFFQKNLSDSTPAWVPSVTYYSEDSKRDIRYALVQDNNTLQYVVNLGCIDHNPWMSRTQSIDSPDYVLFDLDPFHCGFDKVIEAAHSLREILDSLKLESFVKTSGSDGLHIVIPLKPVHSYDVVREFAASVASAAAQARPDLFTLERSLAKRTRRRVYFDYLQIGKGKTIAAPYSVRPQNGAPVSTPLRWEELVKGLRPKDFHIKNTVSRLAKIGDLWAPVLKGRQSLTRRKL